MKPKLKNASGSYSLNKDLAIYYSLDNVTKYYKTVVYHTPRGGYSRNLEVKLFSSVKEVKEYINEAYRTRIKYYNLIRKLL